MSFNPDPNKQAQEVIFSRKIKKSVQPPLIFGNSIVIQLITQKHLRMFLDTKLDFFKDGYFKGSEFIGCWILKFKTKMGIFNTCIKIIRPRRP